mmetsp:Transcript_13648/g.48891  ORF Transcript_13648/g.48891 Transcript_13648/m.48891 type:complete len:232 (-) Transcript_13648:1793-2488(-)
MVHEAGDHLPRRGLADIDELTVQFLRVRVPPDLGDRPDADAQARDVDGGVLGGLLLFRRRRRGGGFALLLPVAAAAARAALRVFALDLELREENPAHADRRPGRQVRFAAQPPDRLRRGAELFENVVARRGDERRQEVRGGVHRLERGPNDHRLTLRRAVALDRPRRGVREVLVRVLHRVDGELAAFLRLEVFHRVLGRRAQRADVEDALRGDVRDDAGAVLRAEVRRPVD